jgi:hypothetical protein
VSSDRGVISGILKIYEKPRIILLLSLLRGVVFHCVYIDRSFSILDRKKALRIKNHFLRPLIIFHRLHLCTEVGHGMATDLSNRVATAVGNRGRSGESEL